jgi:hypothetical protein
MYTMNRWLTPCLSLGLILGVALDASAQQTNITTAASPPALPVWLSGASPHSQRQFPPAARRATMTLLNTQEVVLNDATVRLAPAARIRAVTNTLVSTGVLIGQTLTVNYITDHMGQVLEAWILTEAEMAQRLPADASR